MLPSVIPFDPDALLPESVRGWVMDEADRMPCPPDYVAAAFLVALGSTVGARCAIKPKARDAWESFRISGAGSSGCPPPRDASDLCALKPLDRLAAKAHEAHRDAIALYESDKTIHEARMEALQCDIKKEAKRENGDPDQFANLYRQQRQQAPEPPTVRRFKTNDSTTEKLGELLRDNTAGILVMRDELLV